MPSPYGCVTCGHPAALHSNGKTPCRAVGCNVGGRPCQELVHHSNVLHLSLQMLSPAEDDPVAVGQ
jgi:hypothetical protein